MKLPYQYQIIEELKKYKVLLKGHWKLTSGNHSDSYIFKDKILAVPHIRDLIIDIWCSDLRDLKYEHDYDIITGPAIGGISWASMVAHRMCKPFVYPEKDDYGKMKFRRGFEDMIKGKKLLIVEDIITTAKSINLTNDAIEECGAETYGIMSIWDGGEWTLKNKDWFYSYVIKEKLNVWSPNNCPLCNSTNTKKSFIQLRDPKTLNIIEEDI